MTRDARAFLERAGWGFAKVAPLAGDASNRRYDRLTAPDGATAVLMDAPPNRGEAVGPFAHIAGFLKGLGLSAPAVLARDDDAGFLLLEDLGDRLFAREIAADPSRELPLYMAAAEVLSVLHRARPPVLDVFDAAHATEQTELVFDCYRFGVSGAADTGQKSRFSDAFRPLLATLDGELDVLIQRDFHAENLLWLPDREGVARVGLLDFQDARRGHRAYDLVSVLQDARRNVSPDVSTAVRAKFIVDNRIDPEKFETAYAILGLQRNLRILGIFARLCLRDGKAHYVDLIPRVWGHVQTNLRHPALASVASLIAEDLPPPSPEVLTKLKGDRGSWAGR